MRSWIFCLIAGVLTAAACSSDLPASGIRAECGSVRFASYPPELRDVSDSDVQAQRALAELLASEPQALADRDWFVVEEGPESLVLFGSPTDSNVPYGHITFGKQSGEFEADLWGNCDLSVSKDGFGIARTNLDPQRAPDPTSAELPIVFQERACASGGAINGRGVAPIVLETESAVHIVTFVEGVEGFANCQGNANIHWIVTLDGPLGERTVFDASDLPAFELSWPPERQLGLGG